MRTNRLIYIKSESKRVTANIKKKPQHTGTKRIQNSCTGVSMIYAYFFRSLLLSFNWGCFIVTVAGYLQGGAPMILPPDNLHPCVAVSRWDLMISFWWTECSRRDGMPRDRSGYKKMLASTLGTLSLWGKSHSMLWSVQRIGLELRPSELSSTNTQWSELGSESFLSWNLRWLQP